MRVLWPILGGIVIIGMSLAFFGFSNEQISIQTNVSDLGLNDIKSQKTVSTLTPEIKTIESTTSVITSESFIGEYTLDEFKTQSYLSEFDFQKAYGVSSTQSSLTVQSWSGSLGLERAFDSSWNQFSAATNGLEIAFINVTDNTKKTWTLPNDNRVLTWLGEMDVDSNGNLWFGQTDSNGNTPKLTRLNPTTNVFTEVRVDSQLTSAVMLSSSDEIFYATIDGNIAELDLVQNKKFEWSNVLDGASFESFKTDSSGNFYFGGGGIGDVARLNPNTNVLTIWDVSPNFVGPVNVDSSGNIFFLESDGVRAKVGRITISDNTLTEWIIPNSGTGTTDDIGVDSSGNVFFTENGITRLVPSTGVFTIFGLGIGCVFIEIDTDDTIYCSGSSGFSKIT